MIDQVQCTITPRLAIKRPLTPSDKYQIKNAVNLNDQQQ